MLIHKVKDDLMNLCEDNEVMREKIKVYFDEIEDGLFNAEG